MVWVLVRHRVRDYADWKAVFDQSKPAIQESGALGGWVMRDHDDSNLVSVAVGWPDVTQARAFLESPQLKEAMDQAGVEGPPEVFYMEVLEEVKFA